MAQPRRAGWTAPSTMRCSVRSMRPRASRATVRRLEPKASGRSRSVTAVPVIAIGGITPERVADVMSAGAAGVAVMGSVMRSPDPGEEVEGAARRAGGAALVAVAERSVAPGCRPSLSRRRGRLRYALGFVFGRGHAGSISRRAGLFLPGRCVAGRRSAQDHRHRDEKREAIHAWPFVRCRPRRRIGCASGHRNTVMYVLPGTVVAPLCPGWPRNAPLPQSPLAAGR